MVKVELNSGPGSTRKCPPPSIPSRCGSTQNMASNIKVVVRVRPPNFKEMELNHRTAIDVIDESMLVFDPKEVDRPFFYQGVQQPSRSFLKRPNKELKFVFDRVFDLESSNKDVFDATTKEMLPALMEGYNCSVFVYGATGAGKTFTMIGSKEYPGITYLTMEHLFYMINSFENDREFEIAVSYIEVYNESVFDLLKPSKQPLQLREDAKYGVMVAGLTLHNIKTARELLNMLENGNKNRTQHPTDANAESSRSHAVFQVYVNMRYKTSSEQRVVKLSMIDLAGSERAAATGCVGERFKEGANINRSLLSLGNCINRLSDGSSYIPYRDSKLTRLLKDSLGGNCKTVMIANVSPSSISYEDTYNTLKYAARANKIQLSIKKNIVDANVRVSQYVKINEELTKKVKELEAKLTLSKVVQVVEKEPDWIGKAEEWRGRIEECEKQHGLRESQLLGLMSRQRVLALRRRLRARAFRHVADLAHRSSNEAMEQMYTEDIPRQERAAESYSKQSRRLDEKIMTMWTKWKDGKQKLDKLLEQALAEIPHLGDFIRNIKLHSEMRLLRAESSLRQKLLIIENDEINSFSKYMRNMPSMLKKLFFMLKGYNQLTPSLTTEYLEIIRMAKAGKTISWSDKDSDTELDDRFMYTFKLDLENPVPIPGNNDTMDTDSDEITDIENREPLISSTRKHKVTPIKVQNDTIVIDDSVVEDIDSTRTVSSAKKLKTEFTNNVATDIENYDQAIDPKNLNSTFVLAGKFEDQNIKKEPTTTDAPRGLADRTNFVQRTISFNDKAKLVRPVVGRALPVRRPYTAPLGFGSSLARDGTPLARNNQETTWGRKNLQKTVGLKAVRVRERMQTHPYTRTGVGQR